MFHCGSCGTFPWKQIANQAADFCPGKQNVALLYIAASNLKDMCYVACSGTYEVQV